MTDNEIISKLAHLLTTVGHVSRVDAYRDGMREAARIALGGLLLTTEREWCLGYNAAINTISAAIERAAGGEG